jgi:hypothetical protein
MRRRRAVKRAGINRMGILGRADVHAVVPIGQGAQRLIEAIKPRRYRYGGSENMYFSGEIVAQGP